MADGPLPDPPLPDPRGRNRWTIISLARAAGVALVVIALLMVNDAVPGSRPLGYAMLVAGLAGTFAVPQMLARKWRSRDE